MKDTSITYCIVFGLPFFPPFFNFFFFFFFFTFLSDFLLAFLMHLPPLTMDPDNQMRKKKQKKNENLSEVVR